MLLECIIGLFDVGQRVEVIRGGGKKNTHVRKWLYLKNLQGRVKDNLLQRRKCKAYRFIDVPGGTPTSPRGSINSSSKGDGCANNMQGNEWRCLLVE